MKTIRLTGKVLAVLCMILYGENISAQEFGTHWISCPNPDNRSEVWFRKTFITRHRPQDAKITIATTGRFQLFVNERNVSHEVLLPDAFNRDSCIHEMTFVVSNILRSDSNTIAVWYAPDPHLHTDKQLSLFYYGTSPTGQPFCYKADEDWLCKRACGFVSDSLEQLDNNSYDPSWKACTIDTQGWTPPQSSTDSHLYTILDDTYNRQGGQITKILYPKETFSDNYSITYRFPRRFTGWVRLTIRNATPGETMRMNGFRYICNGIMDEQACRRFTMDTQQDLVIEGDRYFRKSQIQNIEGLVICPVTGWDFE